MRSIWNPKIWGILFFAVWVIFSTRLFADTKSIDEKPLEFKTQSQIHEFTDEIERDFNLRSIGQIQLTNLRGNISVIGWSQDRIKVLAKRHVFAENDVLAKAAFSLMDLRFDASAGNIECSAQYGRGLTIEQRVEERERPIDLQSKMDMVVYAPARLVVKVWTSSGNSSLKGWLNSAELRTISGDISAENVKGERVSALCQNCSAKFQSIQGSLRAITDGGNVSLEDVRGSDIFLETGAGNITVHKVRGGQLYVTKSGNIFGRALFGHIEFQTDRGNVDIAGLSGFASGKSDSGQIQLSADSWEFQDKALIESTGGNITLRLPFDFSAEADLRSNRGTVRTEFNLRQAADHVQSPNHLTGRIGERATDLLKVSSDTGNVELLKLAR